MTDEELDRRRRVPGRPDAGRGQAARADQAAPSSIRSRFPSRRRSCASATMPCAPIRRSASATIVALDEAGATDRHQGRAKTGRCRNRYRSARQGPIGTDVLRDARVALRRASSSRRDGRLRRSAALAAQGRAGALRVAAALRARRCSRVAVISSTSALRAVMALDDSYLFMQGPPGAGKTYTGSHLIVGLLRAGQARRRDIEQPQGDQQSAARQSRSAQAKRRFAFSRRQEVEQAGSGERVRGPSSSRRLRRTPISSKPDAPARRGHGLAVRRCATRSDRSTISSSTRPARSRSPISSRWARPRGTSCCSATRCSSAQPIQGVHPGRSGESTLEYLLDGQATVSARPRHLPRRRPGACTRTCAASSPRPSTTAASARAANQQQRLVLDGSRARGADATGIRLPAVRARRLQAAQRGRRRDRDGALRQPAGAAVRRQAGQRSTHDDRRTSSSSRPTTRR